MNKNYYAAYNNFGTNFTYDSDGWMVVVFDSKTERDEWVTNDPYPNGNPTREIVTAKTAKRMRPTEKRMHYKNGEYVEFQELAK